MPAMTHGQHLAGLAAAPRTSAEPIGELVELKVQTIVPIQRPDVSPMDPPDLLERWLVTCEERLKQPRVSGTELESCRIGLRPWWRRQEPRAMAMMARLDDAEKRAWHA